VAFCADGTVAAQQSAEQRMVDALFTQPNYLAAKKTLDAVALRHEAIATNMANLETPGYRRVDLVPAFQNELARACASGDAQQIASLKPALAADASAIPQGRDGNNVNLEQEMLEMNQNSLLHTLETQLVTSTLLRLKLAITGKSA
jgi:flagellar basal-body rod protein FlgB